jgi:hypothetical protein
MSSADARGFYNDVEVTTDRSARVSIRAQSKDPG